jgi:hypothetical protein
MLRVSQWMGCRSCSLLSRPAQNVSFTPAEARTRNGEARTIFEANTTGVVHIMARVDHVTREARITIQSRPSPAGGGE